MHIDCAQEGPTAILVASCEARRLHNGQISRDTGDLATLEPGREVFEVPEVGLAHGLWLIRLCKYYCGIGYFRITVKRVTSRYLMDVYRRCLVETGNGNIFKKNMTLANDVTAFFQTVRWRHILAETTLTDICWFLVWNDKNGKTAVHKHDCSSIGDRLASCPCPCRLGASTLRKLTAQLRGLLQT